MLVVLLLIARSLLAVAVEGPTEPILPPPLETDNLLYTEQFLESAFDRGVINPSSK